MPRHNHAFDFAFEVISEHEPDDVTAEEILLGLEKRVRQMRELFDSGDNEIMEACDWFDSYEMEEADGIS